MIIDLVSDYSKIRGLCTYIQLELVALLVLEDNSKFADHI
jgi:hypothetical protein